jgi:hypothetical protein
VPRQLPRPRPGNQRQPNYTQNNSTPSFSRTPLVPYRLYSISEKEEEIYGKYCLVEMSVGYQNMGCCNNRLEPVF